MANPVDAATDAVGDVANQALGKGKEAAGGAIKAGKRASGSLWRTFMGTTAALGLLATCGGVFIYQFFGRVTHEKVLANPGLTDWEILSAFWDVLYTNTLGQADVIGALASGATGWGHILSSIFNIASAGGSALVSNFGMAASGIAANAATGGLILGTIGLAYLAAKNLKPFFSSDPPQPAMA